MADSNQVLQSLDNRQIQLYWLHVEVPMTVSKLKRLIGLHSKRKPYHRYAGTAHYYMLTTKLRKQGMSLLDIRVLSFVPSRVVPEEVINFFMKDIQECLDRLNQKKRYDGDSATQFLLPRSKFKFKGGVELPVKFGMEPSLTERLGEAEVRAVQLSFKTSPTGLDAVMLSVSDKDIRVGVETSFYSSPLSALVAQTFMQARTIGSLFVEGER